MAICDLSSKNANVFYELGLRQAFNKKTILITDGRDKAPFDISGFRYVPYSPSLRVDSVEREISSISEMLIETEAAPEDDVNSIVKLLKIKPAHVEPVELNSSESMLFNLITKLQDKIDGLTPPKPLTYYTNSKYANDENHSSQSSPAYIPLPPVTIGDLLSKNSPKLLSETFYMNGEELGTLESYSGKEFNFFDPITGTRRKIIANKNSLNSIYSLPR